MKTDLLVRRAPVIVFVLSLIVSVVLGGIAEAQSQSFSPTGSVPLSVSNSSSRGAFPTTGPSVLIINTGSQAAYLKFGGSTVVATTGDLVLNPGCPVGYNVNGQPYLAAITASSSTSLLVVTGSGVPTLGPTGCAITASVSGTITANQGTGGASPWLFLQAGSTGLDYSANQPTLPVVGANFAASGPYASYVLIATRAANPARANIDIENNAGAQIVIVRDDGTAASSSPPVNASAFAIGGGSGTGSQGGSWSSTTFKGRVQIYAVSSGAQVAVMED